jgi:hypothetical protein
VGLVRLVGRGAEVSIRDNGSCIPTDMLTRVFEMLTQVDRSLERSQGGLGIGLTIVKRLVEMHGGTVEAHSDGPGAGSEFVVRLPVAARQAADGGSGGVGEQRPAPRRHFLVVDDNRDAADSLAMVLALLGHKTRTAHDGLQALHVLPEYKPDVVLLNIGMPRLSGYDARRIREPRTAGMPSWSR